MPKPAAIAFRILPPVQQSNIQEVLICSGSRPISAVSPEASLSKASIYNNTRQLTSLDNSTHTLTSSPSSLSSQRLEEELKVWKRLCNVEVPEGRCVGLDLREFHPEDPDSLEPERVIMNSSHWIHSLLHPEEVDYGLMLPSRGRRETFFIGRIALREALGILVGQWPLEKINGNASIMNKNIIGIAPILKDEHGRPAMPKGYLGSISHKDRVGVGIVARDETFSSPGDSPKVGIGVDLERITNPRRSIARRVLTEDEIISLGKIEGMTKDEEVMLRFSLKECVYKAVHPLICQYVGFQEAQVTPHSNGTASVSWNLKSGADVRLGKITAHWQRLDGGDYFLSSSSAVLLEEDCDGTHSNCNHGNHQ